MVQGKSEGHSGIAESSQKPGKSLKNRGATSISDSSTPCRKSDTKRPSEDWVDRSSATQNATHDPDLDVVVEAWGRLPAAVRAGIVAMVQAAVK